MAVLSDISFVRVVLAGDKVRGPPLPYSIRHGERSGQCRSASVAQAVVLSVWQEVHGFGILYFSVMAGVTNANVCACTLILAIVVWIAGIWQSTHSPPGVPAR